MQVPSLSFEGNNSHNIVQIVYQLTETWQNNRGCGKQKMLRVARKSVARASCTAGAATSHVHAPTAAVRGGEHVNGSWNGGIKGVMMMGSMTLSKSLVKNVVPRSVVTVFECCDRYLLTGPSALFRCVLCGGGATASNQCL
jgi:hypothetical protein